MAKNLASDVGFSTAAVKLRDLENPMSDAEASLKFIIDRPLLK